jgi:DNA-directed RNA polymerase specialized sigma24 family protein
MSSVALPASSSITVPSTEGNLVRQAARGNAEAFEELYRRHSAPAWRLAQAVTADQASAIDAFREGFVQAVRADRFTRRGAPTFRPQVLGAVYRAGADQAYDHSTGLALTRRAPTGGSEVALADAAFRSLPERWRAALWLSAVENLDSERIAPVLGVSTVVAEQLVSRGRRGLAGRFSQAHHEMPEHLDRILRPIALAIPGHLAERTAARWSAAGSDHLPALSPVTAWLEGRALRPMSVAVGALFGLGLIGLGVIPGSPTVRGQFGAAGPGVVNGAVPVRICYGLACPSGPINAFGIATVGPSRGPVLLSSLTGGGPASSGAGGASGSAAGSTTGALSGGAGSGAVPGGSTETGSTPGGSPTGTPGSTSPVTIPATSPQTLGVPGVATVTVSASGVGANVANGTATLSVGWGGVTATIGNSKITTPTTSSPTSTTNPLSGVTKTVTSTVSTLVGGL